jgi:hypothetical protein
MPAVEYKNAIALAVRPSMWYFTRVSVLGLHHYLLYFDGGDSPDAWWGPMLQLLDSTNHLNPPPFLLVSMRTCHIGGRTESHRPIICRKGMLDSSVMETWVSSMLGCLDATTCRRPKMELEFKNSSANSPL